MVTKTMAIARIEMALETALYQRTWPAGST